MDRMIFFGDRTLWNAINEFAEFYNHERNHQGLSSRLIEPPEELGATEGIIACRERLGGDRRLESAEGNALVTDTPRRLP